MNARQALSHEVLAISYALTHCAEVNYLIPNIDYLMESRRLSLAGLAGASGMSQPTLNRIYNNRTGEPRESTLGKLATFAGVTAVELRTTDLRQREEHARYWRRDPNRSPLALPVPDAMAPSSNLEFRPLFVLDHDGELPPGDFVAIPRMGVRLSAGDGYEQPEIQLIKDRPQIFGADFIRRERLTPSSLRVMYADGSSMEPRIQDGDALVVDLSQTKIVDGRVYAIWYPGGERVKRLTLKPGGGLIVASDNPQYETLHLTADEADGVKVLGRVVNTSGTKGL